jgi:hypothetical protein
VHDSLSCHIHGAADHHRRHPAGLDYANSHNVTLVAALGNEHTDLGHPAIDATSPDFPPGTEQVRTVDNSCIDLPTEGHT